MQTTRRGLLTLGAISALGWAVRPRTALGALSVRTQHSAGPEGDTLVTVFLRGGADGLSVIAPYGDEDYYRNRPTLALAHPKDRRIGAKDRVVDLNGFFGLHPALSPLLPLYQAQQLAIVHACGSGDQTRSHFEAMATMERGISRDTGPASGWLARHLESAPWENDSPLRAIALGEIIPASLRGTANTTALRTVADVRLQLPQAAREGAIMDTLDHLYQSNGFGDQKLLNQSGREALSLLRTLNAVKPEQYRPSHDALYPKDELGAGLQQVACLMKMGVGLETASLDHMGYDTHVAQGTSQGLLAGQLRSLGQGLAAFASDLGPERWARTTVVVLSEFGRRVEENSGAGTDHGRAGAMLVLGGKGIAGGRMHGDWPGLAPAQLEGPGDLKVTTDYRNVLAEIIAHRVGNPQIAAVFPGLTQQAVGVVTAHA